MKQPSKVPPTLGRNIRYVLREGIRRGQPRAAIITATWEDIAAYQCSEVNLTVFLDLANDPGTGAEHYGTSVPYDPDKAPGTWHWPSDAGDTFRTLPPVAEGEAPAFITATAPDAAADPLPPFDASQERIAQPTDPFPRGEAADAAATPADQPEPGSDAGSPADSPSAH